MIGKLCFGWLSFLGLALMNRRIACSFFSLVIGAVCLVALVGCGSNQSSPPDRMVTEAEQTTLDNSLAAGIGATHQPGILSDEDAEFIARIEPKVKAFCADCHVMPPPSSSSREEWIVEVDQGYMLYEQSGRSDLTVPPRDEVLKYFQLQAPQEVRFPRSLDGYPVMTLPTRLETVRFPGNRPPGVTNIRWIDLGIKDAPALVYCDIGNGGVIAHWPTVDGKPTQRLATLLQPVHTEPCDLDADGLTDLVVGDIGEFNANDTDLGRVVWLRRKSDSEKFQRIVLLDEISRVADVQPGDFDKDGDQDVLVGIFGWRQTGQIVLLENQGVTEGELPSFKPREIDPRHGAINVTPIDLNADGHLDFVALMSQGYESVEAFINDGGANFSIEIIHQAADPAYGSSGIELVDMDGDGDQDVLYTNGDSFDRGAKPYHSVQWLENQGSYPYQHHHLCEMPGVLDASAKDYDGDGDVDVVAVALLASKSKGSIAHMKTSSAVFLEQTEKGVFKRNQIVDAQYDFPSMESGDFNGDGKIDFAIGTYLRDGSLSRPDLTIWWNER